MLDQIGHECAFRAGGEFTASEQSERRGVVLEQGSKTPAIERPDRGNPRRRAIDLPAEMIEDLRRYQLDRVERPAGQLEKADLQGERQPVQRSAAFPDRSKLIFIEREKVLDLERRQRLGKSLLAEVSMLPWIDRRLFCRAGCGVRNGGAPLMQARGLCSQRSQSLYDRQWTSVASSETALRGSATLRAVCRFSGFIEPDAAALRLKSTLPDFSRANPGGGDAVVVTLTVTALDGRVSTVSTNFPLPRSLWATLWEGYSAFRHAPDNILDDNGDWQISDGEWETYLVPGMFVRDVTLSFFRYSVRYQVDAEGRGTRVEMSNRAMHDGRFHCLGNASGQGDVQYEVPVHALLKGLQLTGDFGSGLGNLVTIKEVNVLLRCHQNFTFGVQTSERRDGLDASETMQKAGLLSPTTMIPSALCCLPVGDLSVAVDDPVVTSSLTVGSWALGVLVPAAIAAAGSVAVLAILGPLLLLVAPVVTGALAISAIIALLVGAGLGAIATLLIDQFIVKPLIKKSIKEALSDRSVATSLRNAGLFRYAGEGLAEALAIKLMQQAQADGHGVGDPGNEGRDRFRSPFFEMIVVSEGSARRYCGCEARASRPHACGASLRSPNPARDIVLGARHAERPVPIARREIAGRTDRGREWPISAWPVHEGGQVPNRELEPPVFLSLARTGQQLVRSVLARIPRMTQRF
jgi:hypothetical protein